MRDRGALRRERSRSSRRRGRLGLGAARRRPLCRLDSGAMRSPSPAPEPTHKVSALRTLCLRRAGHQVAAARGPAARRARGRHSARRRTGTPATRMIAPAGAVVVQHLAPLDAVETDWVAVAERFLGAPYLWGGKTSLGIDCSGLVQVALHACGIRRAARHRHAGGGTRRRLAARRGRCRRSGAAISFSGRAMWASCATAKRCSTPMPTIWRWRASRSASPWNALRLRGAEITSHPAAFGADSRCAAKTGYRICRNPGCSDVIRCHIPLPHRPGSRAGMLLQYQRLALSWHAMRDEARARRQPAPGRRIWCASMTACARSSSRMSGSPARFRDGISARLEAVAEKYVGGTGYAPREGDIVVDIGAGIGEFTLWCADAGARVVAFEPDPLAFACLERNVAGARERADASLRAVEGARRPSPARLARHDRELADRGRQGRIPRNADVEAWPLDQLRVHGRGCRSSTS